MERYTLQPPLVITGVSSRPGKRSVAKPPVSLQVRFYKIGWHVGSLRGKHRSPPPTTHTHTHPRSCSLFSSKVRALAPHTAAAKRTHWVGLRTVAAKRIHWAGPRKMKRHGGKAGGGKKGAGKHGGGNARGGKQGRDKGRQEADG